MAEIDEFFLTDLVHSSDLKKAPDGDLQVIDGITNLSQALFHRLITSPGTLVHRPNYGVGVKDYQNGINNLQTRRKLANAIDQNFRNDFRVQDVTGVSITSEDDRPETVKIIVKIKAAGFDEVPLTFVPFGETS